MRKGGETTKKRQGQPVPRVENVLVSEPDSQQRFSKAVEIALQSASLCKETESRLLAPFPCSIA